MSSSQSNYCCVAALLSHNVCGPKFHCHCLQVEQQQKGNQPNEGKPILSNPWILYLFTSLLSSLWIAEERSDYLADLCLVTFFIGRVLNKNLFGKQILSNSAPISKDPSICLPQLSLLWTLASSKSLTIYPNHYLTIYKVLVFSFPTIFQYLIRLRMD